MQGRVIDGILLVDKPADLTSADVVRAVKRRHRVASIGHLGTLDPMATGLLPLCLGTGTKLAQFLTGNAKSYTGMIRLGIATDTLDIAGTVIEQAEVPPLDAERLEQVARSFMGDRQQTPPMYSAVKVGGRPLYELARAGLSADPAARPITIAHFSVRQVPDSRDTIAFEVACSKGTYVRVLADELGRALGTCATLAALRRTVFGKFRLEEARPLDQLLTIATEQLPVIGPRAALRSFREIDVEPRLAWAIAAGQRAALRSLEPPHVEDRYACAIAPNGGLLAVLERAEDGWQLRRVMMPEAIELYRL